MTAVSICTGIDFLTCVSEASTVWSFRSAQWRSTSSSPAAPAIWVAACSTFLPATSLCQSAGPYTPWFEPRSKQERSRECIAALRRSLTLSNEADLTQYLLRNKISVVFYLIHAANSHNQLIFIKALSAVGTKLGIGTHFLNTTGAKVFSGFAGLPIDRAISDTDDALPRLQAQAEPSLEIVKSVRFAPTTPLNVPLLILWPQATQANTAVLEAGAVLHLHTMHGVRRRHGVRQQDLHSDSRHGPGGHGASTSLRSRRSGWGAYRPRR